MQFVEKVICNQGKEEYNSFIISIKRDILDCANVEKNDSNKLDNMPKDILLQTQNEQWQDLIVKLDYDVHVPLSKSKKKCGVI
jgi:hypothetical protein